ncbi:MAG: SDR family oxidoreductase [bacterium]|nr:SDR family oxidoreductase [bacterium]
MAESRDPKTAGAPRHQPIAVVGVSALFPGSADAGGFWRDILAGRDLITDVPESHWLIEDFYDPDPSVPDKTYAKRGAFLSPIDFDPMAFGIPPAIVPATDTSQLLALIVARQVLEDASKGQFEDLDKSRVSVILGVTSGQELLASMVSRLQRPVWVKALRESGLEEGRVQEICDRIAGNYIPWQESTFPGLLGNVVAGRIANRFDLGGTNCVTDAACASAFASVSMAASELRLGDSDLVIAGGVDTLNDIFMQMCFSKTPALSHTGDCRPFSDQADGTLLGEGLGMVALKRLADAERDGDRIYAVLHGIGTSSDGRAKSVYAPRPAGQARAIEMAYEHAGYDPATVELVEAHGTATRAGDAAEFEGLRDAFDDNGHDRRQWCALGSVKSQIGHTKAAAGAAGLFKTVMALHHKVLPPTIKVERPNPKLALESSPFYLNTEARPWIRGADHPRRASVSSFGFGGSNFHLALEEYQGPGTRAPRWRASPVELVLFTADDAASLVLRCEQEAERAEPGYLAWLAADTQASYQPADHRLALVVTDEDDLRAKLGQAAERLRARPDEDFTAPGGIFYGVGGGERKVAFLFPGQGSQYLNMGADLAMGFDRCRETWDKAAALSLDGGVALHEVVFPRPVFSDDQRQEQAGWLTATEWAQPAIGAVSLSQLALLRDLGIHAECVGGHSYGEITALAAAGTLDADSMLQVARRRGELMREAAAVLGAMTAVSHSLEKLQPLLDAWESQVTIANHNSPDQVVLSGTAVAIDEVERRLSGEGVRARRVAVSAAFHSPLVAGSCRPFREFLDGIELESPAIDVYSNAEAAPYPREPDAIRAQLADQIARPVRFVAQLEAMFERGVDTFIEVGPGSVLTSLVGKCLDGRPHLSVSLDRKGRHGLTSLWHALGRLAAAGLPIDFAPLWRDARPPVDPHAAEKPKMTLPITGTNYGKLYPPPGGAAALPPPNPPRTATEPTVAERTETRASEASTVMSSETKTTPPPQAVAPRTVTPAGQQSTDVQLAWVHAYQEAQRQTADAHAAFQQSMAETQASFLRTMETSFANLGGLLTGQPAAAPAPVEIPAAATAPSLQVASAPPVIAEPEVQMPAPSPVAIEAAAPAPDPPAPVTNEPAVTNADLKPLMLEVVADKTGYPVEMLNLEMDMEADLGIDSIKRVEILSAMREKEPGLPEVDTAAMAQLRTLGQIVDFMADQDTTAEKAEAPASTEAASGPGATELQPLMLEIVAEKTGYPVEMLTLEMDMEADLGIDSIKRVEILSAMRDREPDLPEVDTAKMAELRTLGQIVTFFHEDGMGEGGADAADAAVESTAVEAPSAPAALGRFALRVVDVPAAGLAMPGLAGTAPLAVVDGGSGIAAALVARLAERGLTAEAVNDPPETATSAIFLGGLAQIATFEEGLAIDRLGFQTAKKIAARLAGEEGGVFVTVQDTGGDFGLSGRDATRAGLGGLAGLVKTAAREWPGTAVKAIDLERGDRQADELAEILVRELCEGGPEIEVGLAVDGRRVTLESYEAPLAEDRSPAVTDGAVLLASGGARGVTASTLIALAREARCRFALLGRTPLEAEPEACRGASGEAELKRALLDLATAAGEKVTPMELGSRASRILATREIRANLAAIEAAGSEARYVSADVRDRSALAAALDGVRADWGPITGLVHGAGVIADRAIADKSQEQFDRVFDTKVEGLSRLLEATAGDPLSVLCLFSSVTARCGNPGQSDYAMANEVLNKMAAVEHRRRRGSCRVKSLNWGPWEGGMVTPELETRFAELGVALIPLETGARMMVEELQTAGETAEQVEVVLGGAPTLGSPLDGTTVAMDAFVSRATYPFLDSHTIGGTAVFPVVLALEWFHRLARAHRPDLEVVACRDLKVLRGIRLESPVEVFRLRSRQLTNGSGAELALELRDRDGHPRYSAVVDMAAPGTQSAPAAAEVSNLEPWPSGSIYGQALFHGPALQVISEIEGISAETIAGRLTGGREMGWGEEWHLDAAVLDGGLQLAVLWFQHALEGTSLPLAISSVRSYVDGPLAGPIRAIARCRVRDANRIVADVTLSNGGGTAVAELEGVEIVRRPDQDVAGQGLAGQDEADQARAANV